MHVEQRLTSQHGVECKCCLIVLRFNVPGLFIAIGIDSTVVILLGLDCALPSCLAEWWLHATTLPIFLKRKVRSQLELESDVWFL